MLRYQRRVHQGSGRSVKGKAPVVAAVLSLIILVGLAGCGATGEAPGVTAVSTAVAAVAATTPVPTLTDLPTVPAALTSIAVRETALPRAASPEPTTTPTPTLTPTPSPLPTGTGQATPDLTAAAQASPTPVPTAALTEDVIHILLIGGDTGSNAPDQNTDVLIVAVVNRKSKQVSLLSIPRDLWVHIPTWGYGRINTAHRIGARTKYPGFGPGLLMRTIEENLGIHIDHWIRVDYQGFVAAVDVLGGIDMVVACQTDLRYNGTNTTATSGEVLQPGVYHFDGATALRYVRTRKGESDFERAHRQQQFVKAVWDQTKSPDIIPKIPKLWSAMKDKFKTDLNLGQVLALAPVALDLQRNRVRSRYIGRDQVQDWTTPEGWAVLLPIPEKIQGVVAGLDAPTPGGDDEAAKEAARIQVRNGSHRSYLDQIAADQLRWDGFNVVDTGSAETPDHARTQIIVFNDRPQTLKALVQRFKVEPENVIRQLDTSQPADIQIILGEDYDPCG